MAISSTKDKTSAEEAFLQTFGDIIDKGAAKMNSEQLSESEKKFNAVIDRAAPARKRRRETA
jgi:hypothetical protein